MTGSGGQGLRGPGTYHASLGSEQAAVCVEGPWLVTLETPSSLHGLHKQQTWHAGLFWVSVFKICEVGLWQEQRGPSPRPACPDTRTPRGRARTSCLCWQCPDFSVPLRRGEARCSWHPGLQGRLEQGQPPRRSWDVKGSSHLLSVLEAPHPQAQRVLGLPQDHTDGRLDRIPTEAPFWALRRAAGHSPHSRKELTNFPPVRRL